MPSFERRPKPEIQPLEKGAIWGSQSEYGKGIDLNKVTLVPKDKIEDLVTPIDKQRTKEDIEKSKVRLASAVAQGMTDTERAEAKGRLAASVQAVELANKREETFSSWIQRKLGMIK